MISFIERHQTSYIQKALRGFIAFTFIFSMVIPPNVVSAQSTVMNLPLPGTMVPVSAGFEPTIVKGMTIFPDNPLQFDFIIDEGEVQYEEEAFKTESTKLIKYFLAALTTPEDEMWVNLSPYEEDRIVPEGFGSTEMGRDLLAQDYLLKQLTSSMMYPEDELGKEFWDRVYTAAQEQYGTTDIPINTFNKIWIVPEKAVVYEHGTSAFVVDSHLKVMLEEDYVALQKNLGVEKYGLNSLVQDEAEIVSGVSSAVVREILIPEIEKEVNQGAHFAQLRQIYNSAILATWYKMNLKESLLGQMYVDQNKTKGIDLEDKQINQKIYDQYLEAFNKGVYNYIKEDYDQNSKEIIPRKYFSGGSVLAITKTIRRFSDGINPNASDGINSNDAILVEKLSERPKTRNVKIDLLDVGKNGDIARAQKEIEKPKTPTQYNNNEITQDFAMAGKADPADPLFFPSQMPTYANAHEKVLNNRGVKVDISPRHPVLREDLNFLDSQINQQLSSVKVYEVPATDLPGGLDYAYDISKKELYLAEGFQDNTGFELVTGMQIFLAAAEKANRNGVKENTVGYDIWEKQDIVAKAKGWAAVNRWAEQKFESQVRASLPNNKTVAELKKAFEDALWADKGEEDLKKLAQDSFGLSFVDMDNIRGAIDAQKEAKERVSAMWELIGINALYSGINYSNEHPVFNEIENIDDYFSAGQLSAKFNPVTLAHLGVTILSTFALSGVSHFRVNVSVYDPRKADIEKTYPERLALAQADIEKLFGGLVTIYLEEKGSEKLSELKEWNGEEVFAKTARKIAEKAREKGNTIPGSSGKQVYTAGGDHFFVLAPDRIVPGLIGFMDVTDPEIRKYHTFYVNELSDEAVILLRDLIVAQATGSFRGEAFDGNRREFFVDEKEMERRVGATNTPKTIDSFNNMRNRTDYNPAERERVITSLAEAEDADAVREVYKEAKILPSLDVALKLLAIQEAYPEVEVVFAHTNRKEDTGDDPLRDELIKRGKLNVMNIKGFDQPFSATKLRTGLIKTVYSKFKGEGTFYPGFLYGASQYLLEALLKDNPKTIETLLMQDGLELPYVFDGMWDKQYFSETKARILAERGIRVETKNQDAFTIDNKDKYQAARPVVTLHNAEGEAVASVEYTVVGDFTATTVDDNGTKIGGDKQYTVKIHKTDGRDVNNVNELIAYVNELNKELLSRSPDIKFVEGDFAMRSDGERTATTITDGDFQHLLAARTEGTAGFQLNVDQREVIPASEDAVTTWEDIPNQEKQRLAEKEKEMYRNNEIGIIVMAGGEATRFGGPKTFVEVSSDLGDFLEIKADNLRWLKENFGSSIPLYLLTSEKLLEEFKQKFKERNYYGLSEEDYQWYVQDMVDTFIPTDKEIEANYKKEDWEQYKTFAENMRKENPDGIYRFNEERRKVPGGHFDAIASFIISGRLTDALASGIKSTLVTNIDNLQGLLKGNGVFAHFEESDNNVAFLLAEKNMAFEVPQKGSDKKIKAIVRFRDNVVSLDGLNEFEGLIEKDGFRYQINQEGRSLDVIDVETGNVVENLKKGIPDTGGTLVQDKETGQVMMKEGFELKKDFNHADAPFFNTNSIMIKLEFLLESLGVTQEELAKMSFEERSALTRSKLIQQIKPNFEFKKDVVEGEYPELGIVKDGKTEIPVSQLTRIMLQVDHLKGAKTEYYYFPRKEIFAPVKEPEDKLIMAKLNAESLKAFTLKENIVTADQAMIAVEKYLDSIKETIRDTGSEATLQEFASNYNAALIDGKLAQELKRSLMDKLRLENTQKALDAVADLSYINLKNFRNNEIRAAKNVGGINLNPALLDMQIKRDGNGIPLPMFDQDIESMNIEGFLPIIINVTPINNLPLLLGVADDDTDPINLGKNRVGAYMDKVERFDLATLN